MMTEEQEEWAFYSVKSPDGFDVACHAIKGKAPAGAVEISEAEAKALDDATTLRSPKPPPAPDSPLAAQLQASVDLQPLFDKIDALAKTVISQAQALDEANAKLESQSEDIAKFKQNTVAAIAQMGAGIGSAQA